MGIGGLSLSSAQAQPDVTDAPKGQNPPNWNWNPGARGGNRGGGGGRLQLTPDQLRQLRAQQTEMRALTIRQQLTGAGFTDMALQTAVVNFYKDQSTAQATLLEQWQKIAQAVRVNNATETQMATMLNDFRDSVDKEKARRETASKALDTQIGLSKKPLLDALLMTMGLTGDEAAIVGQTNAGNMAGFMTMLGNMGGGGGFGGGGFGGGGFGGGGNGGPGGGPGDNGPPGGGPGGPGDNGPPGGGPGGNGGVVF